MNFESKHSTNANFDQICHITTHKSHFSKFLGLLLISVVDAVY